MKDTWRTNKNILLVTTKISKHASALEEEFRKLNVSYSRFNSDTINIGDWPNLEFSGKKISVVFKDTQNNERNTNDFSVVWWDELYPCEKIFEQTLYSRWAFLETKKAMDWIFGSLDAHYINPPNKIISSSNKVIQLQKARKLGLKIPETIISSDYKKIKSFLSDETIYKPISRPTLESIDDDRIVLTTPIKNKDVTLESVSSKLSLFQKYVTKKYEVRVYVIGNKVLSAEIHSQESDYAKIDWRNYDIANTPHYKHELPRKIANSCIELTKSFGLTFSAIDLILTPENKYVFLELNPQGMWLWIEKLTGLNITHSLFKKLSALSQNEVF